MVIGILVVAVIGIVGWIAYSQGFFDAKEQVDDTKSIEINLGGSSDTAQ